MSFDRDRMRVKAAELAAKEVYVGTSSWKYEGWFRHPRATATIMKPISTAHCTPRSAAAKALRLP